jgi:hypothetical protein
MANEVCSPVHDFNPSELLSAVEDASTIGEAAASLGLLDVLDEEQRRPMADFLATIPSAIDAAIVAAARDALGRGIRVMFSWQPAYDFELRLWDVATRERGMLNVHILSPHPVEAEPAT